MDDIWTATSTDNMMYNISGGPTTALIDQLTNASSPTKSMSKNVLFPSTMFCIGVVGNLAAILILTIRPSKDNRATAFYQLVKALVFTDLIGIVASSPVTISVYIKGGGILTTVSDRGWPLCHYFSFVLVWAGDSTMFLVLIMACERFLVTKFPFQYTRIVKPITVNGSIVAAISISTIMGLLPIIGMGSNRDHWPGTWCFFDYRSPDIGNGILSFFYAITGLTIIIITSILNIIVIRHLWRMRKVRLTASVSSASFRSTGDSRQNSGGPDSERRMVIFLMAIIIVFTLCYAPFMVRILMNRFFLTGEGATDHSKVALDDVIDLWALRLASTNQLLDPWIYIISRVTCCKGPKNRDDAILPESRRSPATARHSIANPALQDNKRTSNGISCNHPDSRLGRTLDRVRRMWSKTSGSRNEATSKNSFSAGIPLTKRNHSVTVNTVDDNDQKVSTANDSLIVV